jgi:predicted TPR repeat methyltransferase
MSHMRPADFEALYQQDSDPWGYETSGYERAKYDATLEACGPGPFAHALELGSSIGVLSARLAGRCRRLTTVDGSPTAVQAARHRLGGRPAVDTVLGEIPDAIPGGPYDLVLASEILYYLGPEALQGTLERVRDTAAGGARLVAVHWRPEGSERPFTAAEVHDQLRSQTWLQAVGSTTTNDYLLDVLVRR